MNCGTFYLVNVYDLLTHRILSLKSQNINADLFFSYDFLVHCINPGLFFRSNAL